MATMKPILFNTEMVRAILDGRKTVTRRVVKPIVPKPCELRLMTEGYHAGEWHLYCEDPLLDGPNKSPWGAQYLPPFNLGDILYVRETWSPLFPNHTSNVVVGYMYKADDFGVEEYDKRYPNGKDWEWLGKWKPSIHMPKEAARIFLRVTGVSARKLQQMNYFDYLAEGLPYNQFEDKLEKQFKELWNGTVNRNNRNRYGWHYNPWVWVIQFERCEMPKGE